MDISKSWPKANPKCIVHYLFSIFKISYDPMLNVFVSRLPEEIAPE
jgi:hypothetical protein